MHRRRRPGGPEVTAGPDPSSNRPPVPSARLPGGLAPLGFRNFALYWIGLAASNGGKWVEITGAVWVAYELTGSAFLLGLMGIVRSVPTIALSPIAGVLVDRMNPWRVVMVTQSIMLVTSLVAGLLLLAGRLELWQLYLEILIQSGVQAVDYTARQTLFPRLVPREHLVESVTLASSAARTASFVGPAIGGLVIALLGEAAPFLLNAATFLLLMGALLAMRDVPANSPRTVGRTWRSEMAEGWRYLFADPVLRGLLVLELVYAIFQMNPVLITIVAREVLGVGPEGLGGLLSALSAGALAGTALLIAIRSTSRPGRFVTIAAVACGLAMLGFAAAIDLTTAIAALLVTGVLDAMVSVTRQSIAQLAADERMRGRVIANTGTVVRGLQPMAQAQSGFVSAAVGGQMAVVVASVALGVSAALVGLWSRPLWNLPIQRAPGGADAGAPGRLVDR